MTYIIRRISPADAQAYETFMAGIFAEELDTLVPRPTRPTPEQVENFVTAHTGDASAIFLAEEHNNVIGAISLSRLGRPQLDHSVGIGLNVAKEKRNIGLGRSLLTHGLKWAAQSFDIERAELEVMVNNLAAIHLYESFGFICEGVKRNAVKKANIYFDIHSYALLLTQK